MLSRVDPARLILRGLGWASVAVLCGMAPLPGAETPAAPALPWQKTAADDLAEERYQKLLDEGLARFIDGDYEKAADFFRQAMALKPGEMTAIEALKSAEDKLAQSHENKEKSQQIKVEKAGKFIRSGEYMVAGFTLKSVLDENPGHEVAQKLMIKLLSKVDAQAGRQKPDTYAWHLSRGLGAYISGRYAEALAQWKTASGMRPDDQLTQFACDQAEEHVNPSRKKQAKAAAVVKKEPSVAKSSAAVPVPVAVSSAPLAALKISQVSVQRAVEPPLPPAAVPAASLPPIPAPVPEPLKLELPKKETPATEKAPPEKKAPDLRTSALPREPELPPPPSEDVKTEAAKPVPVAAVREPEPIPSSSNPDLEDARRRLDRQEYAAAVGILRRYYESHPEDGEALELLKQAVSRQKRAATDHYNQGLLAFAGGNYPKAVEQWQKVLKIDPAYPNAKKFLLKAFFEAR